MATLSSSNYAGSCTHQSVFQNAIGSLMIGLGPGIYGVLTTLGAGGGSTDDIKMQNVANTVLYVVFFIGGFFSGSIMTTIGPRLALMIGSIGYPVFAGGLWYFTRYGNYGYPVFGGALLGISACLLWTSTGYIASSYSVEDKKGAFISMQFWVLGLFSTAASLVAFGINYHATTQRCPNAVYIVFICLSGASILLPVIFIEKPQDVVRADGTKAATERSRLALEDQLLLQKALLLDWRMLLLATPFFAGELVLAVSSTVSAAYFNIRTRTLNTVMFNIFQIVGAVSIRYTLDSSSLGQRRRRGNVTIAIMSVVVIAGWSGLIAWLSRHHLARNDSRLPLLDWSESAFGGFLVINILLGINMSIYQAVSQWVAAALTNDPDALAGYSGYAKGWLAGGLAVSFGIEASGLSQLRIAAFCLTLQAVGLTCMLLVCTVCVKDTSDADAHIPLEDPAPQSVQPSGPASNW